MADEVDEMSVGSRGSRSRDVCEWLGCAVLGEEFDLRLLQSAKAEIERLRLTDAEREAVKFYSEAGVYWSTGGGVKHARTLLGLLHRTK